MRTNSCAALRCALIAVALHAIQGAALASAQDPLPEPVEVEFVLLDGVTGVPIPGVSISADGQALGETGADGQLAVATLRAPDSYLLSFTAPAYLPFSGALQVKRAGTVTLRMTPRDGAPSHLVTGIAGVAIDPRAGRGIEGVWVSVNDGERGLQTNADGVFSFEGMPPGRYTVRFSHPGYLARSDTVQVAGGRVARMTTELSPEPVGLAPIEVVVEKRDVALSSAGFYDRKERGWGAFIDREEIEQRNPFDVTDLFTMIPGVRVTVDPNNVLRRVVRMRGEQCAPRYFLDGVPTGSDVQEFIDPTSLAGVEVYASAATVPPRYNVFGRCGVILLWTRTGRPGGG